MPHRSSLLAVIVAGPLALGGCATERARPIATLSPPAPRPQLSPSLAAVTPPPGDGRGGYRTINSDIDTDRTVWHVRAALNVAAIACRGPRDATLVPAYNRMLSSKKALLAEAHRSFVASVAADGQDSDVYTTRLYNFFAMPAAKPAFCAAADALAARAAETAPAGFEAFAVDALPRLEAPFLAVYRAVDEYRLASAAWDARDTEAASDDGTSKPSRPRLAYADLDALFAWAPRGSTRLAAR